jgi:signal transduction histidine kinase
LTLFKASFCLNMFKLPEILTLGYWSRRRYSQAHIFGVMIGVLVAVLALVAYSIYSITNLRQLSSQLNTSSLARANISQAVIRTQQAQASAASYIVSGDRQDLNNFHTSYAAANRDVNGLMAGNFNSSLRPKVKQFIAYARQDLELARQQVNASGGTATTATTSVARAGKVASSIQPGDIASLESDIKNELGQNLKNIIGQMSRIIAVVAVLSFVAIGLFLLLGFLMFVSLNRQKVIESSRDEFINLAAHNLRTPATIVKQYLAMVSEGYFGEVNDRQKTALATAATANERKLKLIDTFLNVAELNSGRKPVELTTLDIKPIVESVVKDYRPVARSKHQHIKLKTSLLPITVSGNAEYVRSALDNIINNAVKFSSRNKTININVTTAGDEAVVEVGDEGIGVKGGELGHIFNKFAQADSGMGKTTGGVSGSGLGLFWTQEVINMQGGRVTVDSKYGKGSTFRIYLKIYRPGLASMKISSGRYKKVQTLKNLIHWP